jgi:ELWxxDGT repeat protein
MTTKLLFAVLIGATLFANAQSFQLVKDLNPTAWRLDLNCAFVEMNGKVYYVFTDEFSGKNGIYVTNGASEGTSKITPENVNVDGHLIVGGNKIYFFAYDGTNGKEPWVSDGTTSGTQILKNIHPNTNDYDFQLSNSSFLSADANKAYFIANDGVSGNELWVTDGTSAGTNLVKDIFAGPNGSQIQVAPPAMGSNMKDGKLYFFALDGSEGFTVYGKEPWVSDGTSAGTFMLKDINPGYNGSSELANIKHFIEYKGKMYFFAIGTSVMPGGLFETDGTKEGTKLVFPTSFYRIDEFIVHNNLLYFTYSNGPALYTTDGTNEGTKLLAIIPDGQLNNLGTCQMASIDNTLYLRAVSNSLGSELFKLNESNEIVNVKDIWTGISNGVSGNIYQDRKVLQVYDNKIWFLGSDGTASGAMQVWNSDGTSSGTVALSPLNGDGGWAGGNGNNYNLFASSIGVFMIYNNPITGPELYFYGSPKTSTKPIEADTKLSVYPNPCKDYLTLSSAKTFDTYTITNIAGQLVQEGKVNKEQITLQMQSKGIFLLQVITSNGEKATIKFIKN